MGFSLSLLPTLSTQTLFVFLAISLASEYLSKHISSPVLLQEIASLYCRNALLIFSLIFIAKKTTPQEKAKYHMLVNCMHGLTLAELDQASIYDSTYMVCCLTLA